MAVVFIASGGQLADSWAPVVSLLRERSYVAVVDSESPARNTAQLESYLDKHELRRPALVGYESGAVAAIQVAARRPVERLVLTDPILCSELTDQQAKISRRVLKMTPGFVFKRRGHDKNGLLAALDEVQAMDLTADAARIDAHVLVMASESGLDAARNVVAAMRHAELRKVPAGGPWHRSMPEQFVALAGLA